MKPICLTRIAESGKRVAIWVNPAHIVFFTMGYGESKAELALTDDRYVRVLESPEWISDVLERRERLVAA